MMQDKMLRLYKLHIIQLNKEKEIKNIQDSHPFKWRFIFLSFGFKVTFFKGFGGTLFDRNFCNLNLFFQYIFTYGGQFVSPQNILTYMQKFGQNSKRFPVPSFVIVENSTVISTENIQNVKTEKNTPIPNNNSYP